MGVFGNIKEAKVSEGGDYLQPGVYRLEIRKVTFKTTRKGQLAYIVEFKVLESDNPKHRVGSTPSWCVTLDKEPAMGNIKQFIATACQSTDLDAVDEETADKTYSEEQPLTGQIVRASVNEIITRAGRPFNRVKFILDSEGTAGAAETHRKFQ